MSQTERQHVALDVLMERMSDHLDLLASKVFDIEEALGKAIGEPADGHHEVETITRLQSLDFLRQSLEDLALLSCSMSKHASIVKDGELPVETFKNVLKLDSTKQTLFEPTLSHRKLTLDEGGELDLF